MKEPIVIKEPVVALAIAGNVIDEVKKCKYASGMSYDKDNNLTHVFATVNPNGNDEEDIKEHVKEIFSMYGRIIASEYFSEGLTLGAENEQENLSAEDKATKAIAEILNRPLAKEFLSNLEPGTRVLIHCGEAFGIGIKERFEFQGKDIILRSCPELKDCAYTLTSEKYLFSEIQQTMQVLHKKIPFRPNEN